MLKPLTVWVITNWKILKEMGIPDHLSCLLRNLYAGQEATARTRQGTMKVKVSQLCLTLCDPTDYRGHGILQARILEWVPFPSPGDLPNPGVKLRSPALQVESLPA